jgi:hypothetical protein
VLTECFSQSLLVLEEVKWNVPSVYNKKGIGLIRSYEHKVTMRDTKETWVAISTEVSANCPWIFNMDSILVHKFYVLQMVHYKLVVAVMSIIASWVYESTRTLLSTLEKKEDYTQRATMI